MEPTELAAHIETLTDPKEQELAKQALWLRDVADGKILVPKATNDPEIIEYVISLLLDESGNPKEEYTEQYARLTDRLTRINAEHEKRAQQAPSATTDAGLPIRVKSHS